MMTWPQYACAILEDPAGRLLLELRPTNARFAPGLITCFGGRREEGESPEDCLRRELMEELGWQPASLEFRVALWVADELIAWFYLGKFDVSLNLLRVPPGYETLLISPAELSDFPLSPWHAAVLAAWRAGSSVVEINE
jgi:8-oxo-dGTP pyrophosphatase MutT (NUDIX family)